MAKLYFRYGTVGSAKTLNLLAVAHNYQQQKKRVLLLKPELDDRFGQNTIKSRSGLAKDADFLVAPTTRLSDETLDGLHCILVDEAQFLSAAFVDHLSEIVQVKHIPVICYGLRTDFRKHLFEGSQRLLEVADSIEEVKNTCHYCNRKAIYNLKLWNGKPTLEGPKIDLGAEEKYLATCRSCFEEQIKTV